MQNFWADFPINNRLGKSPVPNKTKVVHHKLNRTSWQYNCIEQRRMHENIFSLHLDHKDRPFLEAAPGPRQEQFPFRPQALALGWLLECHLRLTHVPTMLILPHDSWWSLWFSADLPRLSNSPQGNHVWLSAGLFVYASLIELKW